MQTRSPILALAFALGSTACGAVPDPSARPALVRSDEPILSGPALLPPLASEAPPPMGSPPGEARLATTALPPAPPPPSACNEQPPQEFLKRSHYTWRADATPEERVVQRARHRAAVEWRTRRYGFVEGAGEPAWNRRDPRSYAKDGRFFGVPVQMNARVLVALGCVEESIRARCGSTRYVPEVLDGLRSRNTFHNDEVSNHLYGIAIDVDPNENPCCGCVPPLSEWPRCKVPAASPFERTAIPRCWVAEFERFGFHWLGNDVLEDTMHFEFLGDPDRIARADAGGG